MISCYGARKGLVDTALRTANAGYLTRRLVDVAHHVVVSQFDCKTNRGIVLRPLLENGKERLTLQSRLMGRVLAENVYTPRPREPLYKFPGALADSWPHKQKFSEIKGEIVGSRNQQISYRLAEKIAALWDSVLVRSPLSCNRLNSICQLCYGWSLAESELVSLGEAVGVIAAQSIGEPGTQLTMRTFHTGGVFSGDMVDEIRAPLDGEVDFKSPIQGKLVRTSHGKIAYRTMVEGQFLLTEAGGAIGSGREAVSVTMKIPRGTVLFVQHGEGVVNNQLLAEIPVRFDDKVREPFYYSSELEGKVYFQDLYGALNSEDLTLMSHNSGEVWVLAGQIPAALDRSFLTDGDFIDHRSVLSRESSWLSWEGVVSNLSPLVHNKTKYQGKESREELLTERSTLTQNFLCKPYHSLRSNRIARFQVGEKGVQKGCFTTNSSTCLAGQVERGKRLLSESGNHNIDINQPFLCLPWADIQYKKVGYLLSHPTNRRSGFLCPQPWLTQHASQPLASRETSALQLFCQPSRPKGNHFAPGTTKQDCFVVSSSLSKVFKTTDEAKKSFYLRWFPIQYRTDTGSLTRNSYLYLFEGRGQLLWTLEEGYRVRLMRYFRGKQTELVLHAKRKQYQNSSELYTARILIECKRSFSHLVPSKKESVSASACLARFTKSKQVVSAKQANSFARNRLLKPLNTRQTRTRSRVLPGTKQLGGKVHGYTKPLSSAFATKGRTVKGKPTVLQAKQGTKRLQRLIGKQSARKKSLKALSRLPQGQRLVRGVGLQAFKRGSCGIQLKWVERGFVLGLQNNLQGNQVPLTASFNGWLAAFSPLQPFPPACKARKPGTTKPRTTFSLTKNLLKGCIERSVDRSYRARIQTFSPALLDRVRKLVRRKQYRNRVLCLAKERNKACSASGMCTPGPDRSASPKARNHLFYKRPRTTNTIRCQTGFAFNQLVKAWPLMVTRGSCAEIPVRKHKPGLGAALHSPLLLGLLRRRSHRYKSLIQNPCPNLLGGGLVFLEANVVSCFDNSLARLYSKKLFLWDVKQNPAHKLKFWAVDCEKVFDSQKAEWERKGLRLKSKKSKSRKSKHLLGLDFSYSSLKTRNVWHSDLVPEHKPSPPLAREKCRPCPRRCLLLLGVLSTMPSTGLAYAMRDQAATQLRMRPGLIFFSRTQTNQGVPPFCGGSRAQAALLHQSFLPPGLSISNCYFQAYKEEVAPLEEESGVTFGKSQTQTTSKSQLQAKRMGLSEGRNKNRLVAKEEFALCGVLLRRSTGRVSQLVGLVNSLPPGKPAKGVWRLTGHENLSFNSTFVSTDSVRTFPFYSTGTLRSWLQDKLCFRVSLKESKTSLITATRTNTTKPFPTRQQLQQAGNKVRVCGPSCDNLHKTLYLSSKLGLVNSTAQHAAKNGDTNLLLKQDLCSNQPKSGAVKHQIGMGWQPWQCKATATVLGQSSQSTTLLLLFRLVFSNGRANPLGLLKPHKRFLFDLYRGFTFFEFLPLFLVVGNKNSRWAADYKNDRPTAACSQTRQKFRYQEWLIGRGKASHQLVTEADPSPTIVSTNQGVQVTRVKPFSRNLPGLTGFSLKQTTHKTFVSSNTNRFKDQKKKHLHAHRTRSARVSVARGATENVESSVGLQGNMSLYPLGLKLLATVLSLVGKGQNLEGKKQIYKGLPFWYPNNSTLRFRRLARVRAGGELANLANQNLNLLACKVQSCSVLANSQHKRVIYQSATCSGSAGTCSVRQGASPRPKHRETGFEFSKFNQKSNKQRPDEIEITVPQLLSVKINPVFNTKPLLPRYIKIKREERTIRVSAAKYWLDAFDWKVNLNFTAGSIYVIASTFAVAVALVAATRYNYRGLDLNLTRKGLLRVGCRRSVLNLRESSFIHLSVRFKRPTTWRFALSKSHILPISPLPHSCRPFYNLLPVSLKLAPMVNNNRFTINRALSSAITHQNRSVCDLVGEKMLSNQVLLCDKHTLATPSTGCFSPPALHRFKVGRKENSNARAMSQACCADLVKQKGHLARNKVSDTLSRRVNPLAFGKCFHLTLFKRGLQPVKLGKHTKVVRRRNKVLAYRNGWTSKRGAVLTRNFGAYTGEVTSSLNRFGCLVLTRKDQACFNLLDKLGQPGYKLDTTNSAHVGQLVRYGHEISPERSLSTSGQVLEITCKTITVRKAHPIRIPRATLLYAQHNGFVKKQENLLVMWYQKLTTGDIVQGIPKIEQLFEARQTKDGMYLPNNLADRLNQLFYDYQTWSNPNQIPGTEFERPHRLSLLGYAARKSVKRVQLILVDKIQRVYLSQGVVISDKHLEIVACQMTSKARIVEGGSAGLVHDELVDFNIVDRYNSYLFQRKGIRYEPTVLGITKTSLESRSALSAASFQETTRALTKAGIQPKLDLLGGLKQKVIIGDPICAGTGFF